MTENQQPDLRFLMPVSDDMFPEHRPGSLPPAEILRYTRAAVAEIEQMLKLYHASSEVHFRFVSARNELMEIANGCIHAYNEGLAADTGNEELERAKEAARKMARMQAEATRQANHGGPRSTVNSQRSEGDGSEPSTVDRQPPTEQDDALAGAEVKETMTTRKKSSPARKRGGPKKRKKPNVRKAAK